MKWQLALSFIEDTYNGDDNQIYVTLNISKKHKNLYKFLIDNGYENIETALIDLKQHHFKYPIIVKRVDSSGSKGVGRIDCFEEAEEKIEYAMSFSRAKKIIIEEFVEKFGYQIAGDGYQ